MSKVLKLLPVFNKNDFSHDVLTVSYDFDESQILAIDSMEIDDGFDCYLATHDDVTAYGEVQEDSYGKSLRFVLAKDLCKCELPDLVKAYISSMKPRDKVVLFWD